jgi:hypothetical protein
VRRLPETMTVREVERRASDFRWRLIELSGGCVLGALISCLIWIWQGDTRWMGTTVLLVILSLLPLAVYAVVRTPGFIPRLAEHYRVRGVEIDDGTRQ